MPKKDEVVVRVKETNWTRVFLRDDNIIITEEMPNYPEESSVEIANEILDAITEVCDGEVYPLLARFGNRQVNKDERQLYMNQENHNISQMAMLVNNPFQSMLANFFLGINKVPVVSKVFTDEDKAIRWLNSDQKKN